MSTTIRLFDFQEQAASQLSDAIEEWVQVCAEHGPPTLGRTPIPFVGHLKAVTGAGKTPILSTVVGDLKHGLVVPGHQVGDSRLIGGRPPSALWRL